jgi:hypothetical protein
MIAWDWAVVISSKSQKFRSLKYLYVRLYPVSLFNVFSFKPNDFFSVGVTISKVYRSSETCREEALIF